MRSKYYLEGINGEVTTQVISRGFHICDLAGQTRLIVGGSLRRYLLRLGIIASYLISVNSVVAGSPDKIEFVASTPYNNEPVTLRAELYRPAGSGPYPAVVLMHGCGGMQSSVRAAMHRHAEYLVNHGFVTLSLDSFGPRKNADGWVCETFDRLMAARRYRTADALDALGYLQSLDYVDHDSIFQMGQSNGGSVAIRLAQLDEPAFRATAAYYPWCGTFNRFGNNAKLNSPLIVMAGAADDWTPPGQCQTVQSTGAEYSVVVYPDAVHSFDLEIPRQEYQGYQVGYDASATIDSRKRMAAFFHRHLSAEMKANMPAIEQIEAAEIHYLSGVDIKALIPTGKLKGINGYGNPYTISYTSDGAMSGVAGKSDEYKDSGKWWVKDNSFCRQYRSWLDGQVACFRISLEGDAINFFNSTGGLVSSGIFER